MAQIVAIQFPDRDAAELALRHLREEVADGDGDIAPLGSTDYDHAPGGVVLAATVTAEGVEAARAIAAAHGGVVIYEAPPSW